MNRRKQTFFLHIALAVAMLTAAGPALGLTAIPDTGQTQCFGNSGPIDRPSPDQRFYGQDAHYRGNVQTFRDNGDGTVSDLVTGLMWSRAVDAEKVSLAEAQNMARELNLGGYGNWRVPTIKELYSLINFSGNTGHKGRNGNDTDPVPYINTDYFNFKYGNTRAGERYIDAQWLSSTQYVSKTMDGADTLFGVNFADGRIKGYGYQHRNRRNLKKFYVRFVRGKAYGKNDFRDNGNGTVTDRATGLMWMTADSGTAMTWESALAWAEAGAHAGYTDWRLPNAKELQYIVDYTRSPDTTGSPAIDPVFTSTPIKNEAGRADYPHYWTATTHLDGPRPGDAAVTVCFGRALGKMRGKVMDVHGAGAQRSDPKQGRAQIGRGPQGDARRPQNFVRLVRGGTALPQATATAGDKNRYPCVVTVDAGYEADLSSFQNQPPRQPDQTHSFRTWPGKSRSGTQRFHAGRSAPDGTADRFVLRLDRDGDGQVSRSEFDGPAAHFDRLDRNRDGLLSADEAPAGPPPRRPSQWNG